MSIQAHVPRVFVPLLQKSRYKAAHGGRGGGKSHFFAEQIALRCYSEPTRVVCIREVQNSIKESVRQLIIDKITKHCLEGWFQILNHEIRAPNGSLISFHGMQSFNAENIKSLEGYDVAWVEEAQTLSDVSWRMLRPTIRKPGSEIWCSWNPRHDTDAVDMFFRGEHKPSNAITVNVNWWDNPWFDKTEMVTDKDLDFAKDPEMAEHVWNGGYLLVTEGAYYARLISQAEKEGRIGDFPYDPRRPVITSWDLGIDDYTAIWFWQEDGLSATVIDFYEASGEFADEIIATALPEVFKPPTHDAKYATWNRDEALRSLGRDVPYRYGKHFMPHDIAMREWAARSRILAVQSYGLENVKRGVATNPADRIEATRKLLPLVKFNNTRRVQFGIKRLRRYQRKWNDTLGTYMQPLRDDNTHAADAAGEFAVNCDIVPAAPPKPAEAPKHVVFEALPGGGMRSNMDLKQRVEDMIRRRRAANE